MILITSGCSFSECISTWIDTWPRHLARALLGAKHISGAMGSQGNGLISRSIIHHVSRVLTTTPPEDILVGIAWSGPDRYDFYGDGDLFTTLGPNKDGWMENPTRFNKGAHKKWVILNHNWTNSYAKQYYSTFHSNIGSMIYSLEHMLRVQWFLESKKVKYFMTTYTADVFSDQCSTHADLKHLYELIDHNKFLPVEGIYEWCRDYSNLPFPNLGDKHPSTEQHKVFTDNVILPFLKEKEYI